jgi:uncharacterized protein YyaL (SSP411 family)
MLTDQALVKDELPQSVTQPGLEAALEWIERAHRASTDGGISKGYDSLRRRWSPSYPETTGYTIPTLLNAAAMLSRSELRVLALALADYLLRVATPEGAVGHWTATASQPIVFDTGQVIFGWLAAYEASQKARYLEAAMRAGNWLAANQGSSGAWTKFQHLGVVKTIDTRVAWALLELHRCTQQPAHRQAAERNLEWTLGQQDLDGWFRHCAFREGENPFTHTLVYTAEGLFESGCLLGDERYIEAAARTAEALLARQRADGWLASTYRLGWQATSRSCCLTGNCQASRLWLRLFAQRGNPVYAEAAQKAITFVSRTQKLKAANPGIRGGIAGSAPIFGRYERFKYPNWAAKFYIDALLTWQAVKNGGHLTYVG